MQTDVPRHPFGRVAIVRLLIVTIVRVLWTAVVLFLFSPSLLIPALAVEGHHHDDLLSRIIEAQSKRERLYDDGHYVWTEVDAKGPSVTTTQYEYWSKGGSFFRLDTCEIKDGEPLGKIRRMIFTPKGVSLIYADTTADRGSFYKGSASERCKNGFCAPEHSSLANQYFLAHGNRWATVQVKNIIELWRQQSWDLTQFEVIQDDANACVISFERETPDAVRKGRVVMDPETFRVRSWSYSAEGRDDQGRNDQRRAQQDSILVYDKANDDVPIAEHYVAYNNVGPIGSSSVRLIMSDSEPAKLEVFVLPTNDGAGQQSVDLD